MKLHYDREQEIIRYKDNSHLTTGEVDKVTEISEEDLCQLVSDLMLAMKADHYELKSAHLYFEKKNKRRCKRQKIHMYNW